MYGVNNNGFKRDLLCIQNDKAYPNTNLVLSSHHEDRQNKNIIK